MREIGKSKVKKRGKDVDVVTHELDGPVPTVRVEATLDGETYSMTMTIGAADAAPVGDVSRPRLQEQLDELRDAAAEVVAARAAVRANLKQLT
jgi:hypothetical protein